MQFKIERTLTEHQTEVITKINSLRETKFLLPITYLTIPYDADLTAQGNIQGKILEIESKLALGLTPTKFFWKDATNVIQTWSTTSDYLTFLRNLAILIAERGTNLYAISWTKKAEVMALLTPSDVVSYDITTGW
jgi:hypothetical protein